MDSSDNRKLSELIDPVKLWVPRRPEPATMSRDFWMPDSSCRVCYECDSQFTIFNRRHHCRLCGRVFCAKCTTNCVLTPSDDHTSRLGDQDRIRVCKFCLHQRKQQSVTDNNMMVESSPGLSLSPSSSSSVSTQSSCCTCNSGTTGSTGCSTRAFHQVSCADGECLCQSIDSVQMDSSLVNKDRTRGPGKPDYLDARDIFSEPYGSCSRSDEEDDDYLISRSHSEVDSISSCNMGYSTLNHCQEDYNYEPCEVHPMEETTHSTCDSIVFSENCEKQGVETAGVHAKEADPQNSQVQSEQPSLNGSNIVGDEVFEYENNGLIWNPPEPEDEEDEREGLESEDDGDGGESATGEWGYLRSNSFMDGESRSRDRSNEEHRRAMKRVVNAHFRSLITQLLQAEKLPAAEHKSWLDIILTLSWEAATLIKPDTSRGGGMDPGGYVKVKCVACGHRNESTVIKGVVCKKNLAHRRMTSKIDKARLLLVGGALEYQRVANHLSSFDTLLQQEMDHLKMAVAKIDAHHPNVLLVEKSVSRYAQDYLLAKNISLVLNIKRPLLERIARCTGAQIVPSIDNLSAPPKLGYCESFHVERFLENLGTAGQGGKKLTKTLMFFEGCPRPLGCTILLKGANGDELKKIKHVVHYGVFAAYHLALETSFLADEGASVPELPLKSPLKVTLPDNLSSCGSSISKIPGCVSPSFGNPQEQQLSRNASQDRNNLYRGVTEPSTIPPVAEAESFRTEDSFGQTPNAESATKVDVSNSGYGFSYTPMEQLSAVHYPKETGGPGLNGHHIREVRGGDDFYSSISSEARAFGLGFTFSHGEGNSLPHNLDSPKLVHSGLHNIDCLGELGTLKEEFTPSVSDHHSILVSLSTRCVWKGSVCERAHIFRIKYYGNFDKPLGRFLRDNLFDQDYRCHSCDMPSEAHVHCYTHRQGSLTISLRKLQEFTLPGEREGKIWMWHRCLRCPRINGLPPATKRIVMSDAAWGLSFGKFLELSFSNHAAASRVASCGHSLHRDCLRFYGFGMMVACFRYAPINVHSVYLPPPKIEFNYHNQEWIQKDFDTLHNRADFLFTEVLKVLRQISERTQNDTWMEEKQILELELMIQIEKNEFEEAMQCIPKKAMKSGHLEIDILEVNKLKKQLMFHAYVWDQRLVHLSRANAQSLSSPMAKDKLSNLREQRNELDSVSRSGRGFSSWDSSVVNMRPDMVLTDVDICPVNSPNRVRKAADSKHILISRQDTVPCYSSSINSSNQPETLQCGNHVRRARSEGQFPVMDNVSDNLDVGWTGYHNEDYKDKVVASHNAVPTESSGLALAKVQPISNSTNNRLVAEQASPARSALPAMGPTNVEDPSTWVRTPFSVIYRLINKNSTTCAQKLGKISEYNPVYISSLRELVNQGGARLLLPMASSDVIVPIYDDEPTSIISYALVSPDYQNLMSKDPEKHKHSFEFSTSFSLLDSINFFSLYSFEDLQSESVRSLTSVDESTLSTGPRSFSGLDQLQFPDTLHSRLTFLDDGPSGKVNYSVTCYFSRQFETLRKTCITSELDFIRSLSRCKKWGAQGGKSNVFFAKTLDDRFIIKQVTKTELESFIKFAPSYFKYLSESINSGCPTCLAKILGIYQVTSKHLKGGKETRIDVLVMENLLFRRNITKLYDLKGSSRSRYNPDSSGSNKVLLDQNLIEAMPTSPIFLGTKAKRLLERAIWNDTSFLASIDVMDYSLLVGLDEEKHELVVGIIDFMRQYTWDKHLESWVKASGILGGPKNVAPTVISPKQYKKRFRKAMSAYFLMVPDEWPCSMTTQPSCSLSNLSAGKLAG